ncbi:Alpha/beta hydrolase fold [Parasponia andersonii]|uniref:Alpha/beta hydrolase fold n=1 Tax=Parasponia andersonii TaxID=3476 RepID=A0A2P5D752_PARAD|nr:Alpha/beta hydrolase fold [Parasponia andersonii]
MASPSSPNEPGLFIYGKRRQSRLGLPRSGFCIQSPFSPHYHTYVAVVTAEANVVTLSVHYRRPPEHPLPIAHKDAWEVVQWATTYSKGDGPEAWLNDRIDFGRAFVTGDSAKGNIAHNMVLRAGVYGLVWTPNLVKLKCDKALVFVAEKDLMRDRGLAYYEALKKSGWVGELKMVKIEREDYIFHLLNPTCENVVALIKGISNPTLN